MDLSGYCCLINLCVQNCLAIELCHVVRRYKEIEENRQMEEVRSVGTCSQTDIILGTSNGWAGSPMPVVLFRPTSYRFVVEKGERRGCQKYMDEDPPPQTDSPATSIHPPLASSNY